MWLVPAHVKILDPVTAVSERLVDGPGVHRVPPRASALLAQRFRLLHLRVCRACRDCAKMGSLLVAVAVLQTMGACYGFVHNAPGSAQMTVHLSRQGNAVVRARAAPRTLSICLAEQTLLSALTASMQAEQLGPGGSRSREKAIFLRQLLQAHPLNGQTALHAAAFLGQQKVIDMLLGHGAHKDARFFLQTGDGLGEREREFFFGERARDAFFFGVSTLPAQAAAYQAAIRASPQNLEAYLRLASVQALLEARSAQWGEEYGRVEGGQGGSAAETWRQAWMLEHEDEGQDEGDDTADQDAYVARKHSNALVGADASGHVMSVPARTLADLSVHLDQPLALQRALSLWRQQGVVVFPAMLAPEAVRKLACHVRAAVAPVHAVPRVANIRNPDFRTLRGLLVRESSAALEAIANELAPFLREALEDHELVVLEHAAYGVGTGAEQQNFHRDDSCVDSRVVSIQVMCCYCVAYVLLMCC